MMCTSSKWATGSAATSIPALSLTVTRQLMSTLDEILRIGRIKEEALGRWRMPGEQGHCGRVALLRSRPKVNNSWIACLQGPSLELRLHTRCGLHVQEGIRPSFSFCNNRNDHVLGRLVSPAGTAYPRLQQASALVLSRLLRLIVYNCKSVVLALIWASSIGMRIMCIPWCRIMLALRSYDKKPWQKFGDAKARE